jgi:hypothetical protein
MSVLIQSIGCVLAADDPSMAVLVAIRNTAVVLVPKSLK